MLRIEEMTLSEAINRGIWDLFGTDSLYLSPEWLTAFDVPIIAGCGVRVAYSADQPVAALVLHSMPRGSGNTVYDMSFLFGDESERKARSWRPQVLLGSQQGQFNAILRRPGWDATASEAALRALVDSISVETAVGVLYAPSEVARTYLRVAPDRFNPVLADFGSSIDRPHTSFDDYLRGLSSAKRGLVRREMRTFSGHLERRSFQPDSPMIADYARLMSAVQTKHDQPAGQESLERYLRTCAATGLEAVVFEVWRDGVLNAFALGIAYGSVLWMRVVGLTYDGKGSTSGDYGHVLVYEPLAWAIEHGLHRIDLGAGVAAAKRLRGASTYALWHLVQPPLGVSSASKLAELNERRARELGAAPDGRAFSP